MPSVKVYRFWIEFCRFSSRVLVISVEKWKDTDLGFWQQNGSDWVKPQSGHDQIMCVWVYDRGQQHSGHQRPPPAPVARLLRVKLDGKRHPRTERVGDRPAICGSPGCTSLTHKRLLCCHLPQLVSLVLSLSLSVCVCVCVCVWTLRHQNKLYCPETGFHLKHGCDMEGVWRTDL